jgi:predicted ester cyclase
MSEANRAREANRALVLRWFDELWNQKNLSIIDELAHPDSQSFGFPDPTRSISRAEYKNAVSSFHQTFSNIHMTVEDIIAEDEKVSTRWSATMTHTGPGLGFEPTGKSITVTGISIATIHEGLVLEAWNAFDLTRHVAQLKAGAQA